MAAVEARLESSDVKALVIACRLCVFNGGEGRRGGGGGGDLGLTYLALDSWVSQK